MKQQKDTILRKKRGYSKISRKTVQSIPRPLKRNLKNVTAEYVKSGPSN